MTSKRRYIVGVMGPGNECPGDLADLAYDLGSLLAQEGWAVLTGGRDLGVMDAVSRGAKSAGGVTIGILPNKDSSISESIDYAIVTDINLARNNVNVLTSDIIVACGMGVGTASEVALGLNAGRHVILLSSGEDAGIFFSKLRPSLVHTANNPQEVVELIKKLKDPVI